MRHLRRVSIATLMLLWLASVAGWLYARNHADLGAGMVGDNFYDCTIAPGFIQLRWISGVPPDSRPPPNSLGWERIAVVNGRAAARKTNHAFVNTPEATVHRIDIPGVGIFWGRGEILRPRFIFYVTSGLLPLRGFFVNWTVLLIYPAILPILELGLFVSRRTIRRSRIRRGLCPTCGYDLRASGDTCPECGEIDRARRAKSSELPAPANTASAQNHSDG